MKNTHPLTDFYKAWWFLVEHPSFQEVCPDGFKYPGFQRALDISVHKCSPKTGHVCNDEKKNTKTRVWLECGCWESKKEYPEKFEGWPADFNGMFCHDIELDCGGDTFEEAIIKLANLVAKEYGRGGGT